MTSAERKSHLEIKPRTEWGWDVCGACGEMSVAERGIVVLISERAGFYAGRMAWCDSNEECRADRRQTDASIFTNDDASAFDEAFA